MNRNKGILIAFTFLLTLMPVMGQKLYLGFETGSNIKFTSLRSDYTLEENIKVTPGVGTYDLFVTKYQFNNKIKVCGSIGYLLTSHKDKSEMNYSNITGEPMGTAGDRWIFNQYFQFNVLISFEILSGLYIGTGISAHYLIGSHTYFQQISILEKSFYKNEFYRPVLFNIPIRLEYAFSDNFSLLLTFNKGIYNSLRGNISHIKEIDNVLALGVGVYFN